MHCFEFRVLITMQRGNANQIELGFAYGETKHYGCDVLLIKEKLA